jgi:hypothetical protein
MAPPLHSALTKIGDRPAEALAMTAAGVRWSHPLGWKWDFRVPPLARALYPTNQACISPIWLLLSSPKIEGPVRKKMLCCCCCHSYQPGDDGHREAKLDKGPICIAGSSHRWMMLCTYIPRSALLCWRSLALVLGLVCSSMYTYFFLASAIPNLDDP